MKLNEALSLAEEKELDLILITPNASPPVARIFGFDKFRYEREKEQKRQKRLKAPEVKRVQISARTATNDLQIRPQKNLRSS